MSTTIFSQIAPAVAVSFHTVESIRVSSRNVPTAHPVEIGVDVTDHIQSQPIQVFIGGARVSESPYIHQLPWLPELVTVQLELMVTLGLVTLVSSVGTFRDMALEAIDYDKTNLRARDFQLTLKKIRLASPVSILIPARTPPGPMQAGMPDATDAGSQPPVPTSAPVDESFLHSAGSIF